VIFWFRSEILEDRLLPVTFHVIPVVYHTVTNRVVDAIAGRLGIREGFIANEEIEVFDAAFGSKMTRFCRNGRRTRRLR